MKKPEALSNVLYLEKDLNLTGDDASELLEEMQKELGVDFSEFNFSLHFSPEAGWPENPEFGYYPVTIGHLVEVAKLKRWFLPEKNEANFLRERKRILIIKTAIIFSIAIIAFTVLFFR